MQVLAKASVSLRMSSVQVQVPCKHGKKWAQALYAALDLPPCQGTFKSGNCSLSLTIGKKVKSSDLKYNKIGTNLKAKSDETPWKVTKREC